MRNAYSGRRTELGPGIPRSLVQRLLLFGVSLRPQLGGTLTVLA